MSRKRKETANKSKPMTFIGVLAELFPQKQVISKGKLYLIRSAIIERTDADNNSRAQVYIQFSDKFDFAALEEMKGLLVKVYLSPRIARTKKAIYNNLNCYAIMPIDIAKYRLRQNIFDINEHFTRNVDEDGYDSRYNS